MDITDPIITIVIAVGIAILILFSAFFSASETSYTSVSKIRLKNLEKDGNKKAGKALRLAENYDNLLTTILVGNNLVNILASSLCTILFDAYFGTLSVVISTLFMLLIILTFGEITPKTMAKKNPEKYAMMFASTLLMISKIFWPITWVFRKVSGTVSVTLSEETEAAPTMTEEELVVMIDQIKDEGTLETTESELIKSAIEFDDKQISEILTPRVDVIAVDKDITMEEMKDVLIKSGFSRIPVYEGTIDHIIGVIYSKDFYSRYFEKANVKMTDIMRPVKFVPETMTVANTLTEIQKSMVQMVVVVDSYGGTVGIVSLEDILEELVGEIWDESDEVQYSIVREPDGTYAVLGEANIREVMDEIGYEFDIGEYDDPTIGGYIQYKLGRIPVKGDRVEDDCMRMIVMNVRNRRVRLVQVILKELPSEDPEEPERRKLLHSLSPLLSSQDEP